MAAESKSGYLNDDHFGGRLLEKIIHFIRYFSLTIPTKYFWQDIWQLFVIIYIQYILNYFFHSYYLNLDLVTSWVMLSVIHKNQIPALRYAVLSGFVLETFTSIPMMTYISSYLLITSLVLASRTFLSWKFYTTRYYGFLIGALLVRIHEWGIAFLLQPNFIFTIYDFINFSFKLLSTWLISLFFWNVFLNPQVKKENKR